MSWNPWHRGAAATAAALAIAALLAGCETTPTRGRVTYACERGPGLTVEFHGSFARLLTAGGPPITLRRRPAKSGFWFEGPTHSIRGRGRNLTLLEGRAAPNRCWIVRKH